jgi:hypothetical protein
VANGENTVIGRQYLVRQAATLLEFAKSTANPELSAVLIEKAADLKTRIDETGAADQNHPGSDVEAEGSGDLRHSEDGRR